MKVYKMDPAELPPADYNPRQIDPHQMEALKRSLDRWGFVEPGVFNQTTGRIVGGHQRVAAALELAMEKVPVVKVKLTEDAEKALNIALNKISGTWDDDALVGLLKELQAEDWELPDLGFSDAELDEMVAWHEEEAEPEGPDLTGDLDAIPEAPADPVTQPGDIWYFDPFYSCEACGKRYSFEEGEAMGRECPCDG